MQNAQAAARYEAIGAWLDADGRIDVADVATRLGVAQETIRRDLRTMESAGRLQRVHGGAVRMASGPRPAGNHQPPASEAQIELAQRVWADLPRQGTILLGTGTLTLALAHVMVADPPERTGL